MIDMETKIKAHKMHVNERVHKRHLKRLDEEIAALERGKVPFKEIRKCGILSTKHYLSGEHERVCLKNKKRLRA